MTDQRFEESCRLHQEAHDAKQRQEQAAKFFDAEDRANENFSEAMCLARSGIRRMEWEELKEFADFVNFWAVAAFKVKP